MIFQITISFLAILLSLSQGSDDCDTAIKQYSIVPDFAVDVKSTKVEVFFEGYRVKCGKEHTANTIEYPPAIAIFDEDFVRCDLMTLLLFCTDPDYLHYVVYNIPTERLMRGFFDDCGDTGAEYEAPTVLNGTKTCALFVYCQSTKITQISPAYFDGPDHRNNFPIFGHANFYRLDDPVYGITFKLMSG